MQKKNKISYQYIAGLLDGEGTICLGERRWKYYKKYHQGGEREKNNPGIFTMIIDITNTNKEIISRLAKQLNIRMFTRHPKTRCKNGKERKTCYIISLRNCKHRCKPLLKALLPHLIIKRRQAELLLEYMKTVKDPYRGSKATLPQHIVDVRNRIYKKLKALNK